MVARYAIIRDGAVENVILWDGASPWSPPAGATMRELGRTEVVDIGWIDQGKSFAPAANKSDAATDPMTEIESLKARIAKLEAVQLKAEADQAESAKG